MTSTQGSLFATPEAVAVATQAGIDTADGHADAAWKAEALRQVEYLARTMDQFTADEVWARLALFDVCTHEYSALGGVMRRAAGEGWIRSTRTYVRTKMPQRHRDVLVWDSLLRAER